MQELLRWLTHWSIQGLRLLLHSIPAAAWALPLIWLGYLLTLRAHAEPATTARTLLHGGQWLSYTAALILFTTKLAERLQRAPLAPFPSQPGPAPQRPTVPPLTPAASAQAPAAPQHPASPMPAITRRRYVIAVPDLAQSAAFYREVLGFTIHPLADPGWLIFQSGSCVIMAGQCPQALPPTQLGDHAYYAHLQVEDLQPYYEAALRTGTAICKPPQDEPWGLREFGLVTRDGHRIMLSQALPTAQA